MRSMASLAGVRRWLRLAVASSALASPRAAVDAAPLAERAAVPSGSLVSGAARRPGTDAKLRAAIASGDRPADEMARDKWRHPLETLEFFGLRDDMTVVELWPGGGWFTAILAPVVAEKGKLVVTSFDPNGPPEDHGTQTAKQYAARLASKPNEFAQGRACRVIHPPADITLGPDGSADAVLTFRNVHNWVSGGIADKVLAAAFRVLKPGGVLGVEEHRAQRRRRSDQGGRHGLRARGLRHRPRAEGRLSTRGALGDQREPQGHQGLARRACGRCRRCSAWAIRTAPSTRPSARATG